jgi:hypothetical protein
MCHFQFLRKYKSWVPDEFDFMVVLENLSQTGSIELKQGCTPWYPNVKILKNTSLYNKYSNCNFCVVLGTVLIVPNDVLTDGGFLLIRDDNSFQKSYTSLKGSPRYSFGVLSKFNEGIYLLYKDVFFKILTFGYHGVQPCFNSMLPV